MLGAINYLAKEIIFFISSRRILYRLSEVFTRLNIRIAERIRQLEGIQEAPFPNTRPENPFKKFILSSNPPWSQMQVSNYDVPGMISEEEKRYYAWLAKSYAGEGEIVELGPWLGCSTFYILEGLKQNHRFKDKRLHVYDDFVWRSSWMDHKYPLHDRPPNHGDFQYLFEKFTEPLTDSLWVSRSRLSTGELEEEFGNVVNPYIGANDIPPLKWNGNYIELLFVDVGRTIDVNEAWWRVFFPHFIPNKTRIIMQDWQTHKEVPAKWYNQIKMFTDGKHQWLNLIHELSKGGAATFLFRD